MDFLPRGHVPLQIMTALIWQGTLIQQELQRHISKGDLLQSNPIECRD